MRATRPTEADDIRVVPLRASTTLNVDPNRVVELLTGDPPGWLRMDEAGESRRYVVDLRLRVGGDEASLTTFRKAAYVDLGAPRRTPSGDVIPIGWRASTAAPLFPVFAGSLQVDGHTLELSGMYAPPGGAIGRLADRALLHLAASGTAKWLLHEIDRLSRATP